MRLTMLMGSFGVICSTFALPMAAQGIERPEIKLDDTFILGVRARIDQEELETARLAATRGSTKEVRLFAQSLLRGHANAQTAARNLAVQMKDEMKITGDSAAAITTRQQARRASLEQLKGRNFDRAFLTGVRDEHAAEIQKVDGWYQTIATNDSVKTYLRDIMPTLVKHRVAAERLLAGIKTNVAVR